jgi:IclR family acetate operon transcriptional repressor
MAGAQETGAAYPIRSVDRVCDILDTLANSRSGATLTEVAEATSLPKSSAFRYLTALEARHYVERDTDAVVFRLGPAFRPQHTRTVDRLITVARPILEQLRDKVTETTNLGILDGTSVVHMMVCESQHMMRLAAHVGDRGTVHSTALGKAICATLPQDRVRSILEAAGMPAYTEHTIAGQDEYFAELDRVHTLGYGVDDMENQADGRCIAVAIGGGLDVPAGVSVSAPASRLSRDDLAPVAKALRRAARDIAAQMKLWS